MLSPRLCRPLHLPRSCTITPHRRNFHLIHQLFTFPVGSAGLELKHLHSRQLPIPPPIPFTLLGKNRKPLVQSATYPSILTSIPPGHYLRPLPLPTPDPNLKPNPSPSDPIKPPQLQLLPLRPPKTTLPFPKSPKHKFKRAGLVKEFHLVTDSPDSYIAHILSKAHEYLLRGARTEFHLRTPRGEGALTVNALMGSVWGLGFRPDVIMRGMPEGTSLLVGPCEDVRGRATGKGNGEGRGMAEDEVMWAFELEGENLLGTKNRQQVRRLVDWRDGWCRVPGAGGQDVEFDEEEEEEEEEEEG